MSFQILKNINFIFSFLLIILLFIYNDCHLIIPLKYYPIYKYNNSNPAEILQTIVSTKVYAIIEIGTPKKTIEIPIDFDSNDFYISDNPIKEFENNPKLFSDIKFYNSLESSSRIPLEDVYFDGNNFNLGEYCRESFYLNNTKYELDFYFPYQLKYPESGGIGLLLSSESSATYNSERAYIKKIKNLNLINDYYWSIFYNSTEIKKEEEGYLLLGSLPHEINNSIGYYNKFYFNEKNIKNINAVILRDILTTKFIIDEIKVFKGNNKSNIIDDFIINYKDNKDINTIELNYHSKGIQAPFILLEKYEKIFEEYISMGECFKGEFNYNQKKYYFYCKNNKEIINNIKNSFPGFNFLSKYLEYNFYLEADDLFLEKDNYVFCLLFFHYNEYIEKNWVMGKPFLKKYQFSFNPDNKQIYFYSNKEEEKEENDEEEEKKGNDSEQNKNQNNEKIDSTGKINIKMLIIIIFAIIIVVSIICFILFKYYLSDKFNRKKRANELDDDYDYIQKKRK